MKVAIITITDGQNYGNRLQNYALQEVLKSLGFEVLTIRRKNHHDKKRIIRVIKRNIKRILGRPYGKYRLIRKKRFDDFNSKYIQFDRAVLQDNKAPKDIKNRFRYFVVGSDQVWNAGFRIIREDLLNYLASFADPGQRISYAASFGTDTIPPESEDIFREELSRFKAISVREEAGIELLHSLGLQGSVVLDPTMLLTAEQWALVGKKPSYILDTPYVLTYFLGGRDQRIIRECIDTVSAGKKVINLENASVPESRIENIEFYSTGPAEFIWLIFHAECVITDSFHATAFSIIFHRPFLVFDRKAINNSYKMGNRIETLLGRFNLEKNKAGLDIVPSFPEPYDIDRVDKILSIEREKSISYLKRALSNEKDHWKKI